MNHMNHRLKCGLLLAAVGLTFAILRGLPVTDATETAATPAPVPTVAVEIVVDDASPRASPCDVDPHFWIQGPAGTIDPGFAVPVSPDHAWADVDPHFTVRIPCGPEAHRRTPAAATPAS